MAGLHSLKTAREAGVIHTLFPVDFVIPMVAPLDLGLAVARLMMEPVEKTGLHHVEGPRRYTLDQVAAAFADVLGKPVDAIETPRGRWISAFKAQGFSDAAADSYAGMTAAALDFEAPPLSAVERGKTALEDYVAHLVARR